MNVQPVGFHSSFDVTNDVAALLGAEVVVGDHTSLPACFRHGSTQPKDK